MYWVDKVAKEILESGKYIPYWVDDMKTPSGFAHIGALRGPVIHSLIYRALRDLSKEAKLTFVINDFDPADELPPEFKEKYKDYLGFPLRKIPSPDSKYDSLGTLIAEDFKKVQLDLGVEAEFLSSYEMYRGGRFDGVIKEALDNAEKIQDIYQKVSGSKKREKGWLPFQVECEKCGKLGTTRVFAWDGKQVSYKCEPDLVVWAQGCGYEGKITPFGGTGKLPWKVDWAAHWKVIGVTIEGTASAKSYALTAAVTYGETDARDVEKIKEAAKKIVEGITGPKPTEPPEVIIEEIVSREAPLVFQGKWWLLPRKPIREFVLAPLPKAIVNLA